MCDFSDVLLWFLSRLFVCPPSCALLYLLAGLRDFLRGDFDRFRLVFAAADGEPDLVTSFLSRERATRAPLIAFIAAL